MKELKGKELISVLLDGGQIVLALRDREMKTHLFVKAGKTKVIEKNGLGQQEKVTYYYFEMFEPNDFYSVSSYYFCSGNEARSLYTKAVREARHHQILKEISMGRNKNNKNT